MPLSTRRGPWLPDEDAALIELVRTQGLNNWVRISQQLQHRSPKQCRERYHQNLKPSLNHDPIGAQEGDLIERYVNELGHHWAEIARRLGNRSDNQIKNWWNGSLNRRRRNPVQNIKQIGNRVHPMPVIRNSKSIITTLGPQTNKRTVQRPSEQGSISACSRHTPAAVPVKYDTMLSTSPARYQSEQSSNKSLSHQVTAHYDSHARLRSDTDRFDDSVRPYLGRQGVARLPPLRLPHPEDTSAKMPNIFCHGSSDKSLISPAVSEFSMSTRRVPSLIPDTPSNTSVSPRAQSSPSASTPALIVNPVDYWSSHRLLTNQYVTHDLQRKHLKTEEDLQRTHTRTFDYTHTSLPPIRHEFEHRTFSKTHLDGTRQQTTDKRMHLSHLIA